MWITLLKISISVIIISAMLLLIEFVDLGENKFIDIMFQSFGIMSLISVMYIVVYIVFNYVEF